MGCYPEAFGDRDDVIFDRRSFDPVVPRFSGHDCYRCAMQRSSTQMERQVFNQTEFIETQTLRTIRLTGGPMNCESLCRDSEHARCRAWTWQRPVFNTAAKADECLLFSYASNPSPAVSSNITVQPSFFFTCHHIVLAGFWELAFDSR